MTDYHPPLQPGKYTTDDGLDSDLGKVYLINKGLYKFVKTGVAVTNAGGKVLVHTMSAGVPTNAVTTTTSANEQEVAGVVPIAGDIAATTALASGTRLLVQISGPSKIRAGTTTVSSGIALGTGTTAGTASRIATTVTALVALPAYIGYATNTVAATAVNVVVTCMLARAN